MNRKALALLAATCLIGMGWWFFSESDEEQIRASLDFLSREGTIEGEEHPFDRLAKAKILSEKFSDSIRVVVHFADEDHVITRNHKELLQKIALARSYFKTFAANHLNTKVVISGEEAAATLLATGHGFFRDGREFRDSIELKVHFQKEDGDWLISEVENIGIWPPDDE